MLLQEYSIANEGFKSKYNMNKFKNPPHLVMIMRFIKEVEVIFSDFVKIHMCLRQKGKD